MGKVGQPQHLGGGRSKPVRPNLFYIYVFVSASRLKDRFSVMTQSEFDELVEACRLAHLSAEPRGGFNWSDLTRLKISRVNYRIGMPGE